MARTRDGSQGQGKNRRTNSWQYRQEMANRSMSSRATGSTVAAKPKAKPAPKVVTPPVKQPDFFSQASAFTNAELLKLQQKITAFMKHPQVATKVEGIKLFQDLTKKKKK